MAERLSANTEALMERDRRIIALEEKIAKLKEDLAGAHEDIRRLEFDNDAYLEFFKNVSNHVCAYCIGPKEYTGVKRFCETCIWCSDKDRILAAEEE